MAAMNQPLIAVRIKDGIFIGNVTAAQDEDFLIMNKVTHIVNCAGAEVRDAFENIGIQYLTFPWKDTTGNVCSTVMFDSADRNVENTVRFIDKGLNTGECVLIHSYFGLSRSCALAAAYLMVKYGWALDSTLRFLEMAHQDMNIKPYFMRQLRGFAKRNEVRVDIFDPSVDESPFGLDNDQWMLRNTFVNGLVADVQEKHELYKTATAQIKICDPNYKNLSKRRRRITFCDTKQGTSVHSTVTQPLAQGGKISQYVDPMTGQASVVSRAAPATAELRPILARRGVPNKHTIESPSDVNCRGRQMLVLRGTQQQQQKPMTAQNAGGGGYQTEQHAPSQYQSQQQQQQQQRESQAQHQPRNDVEPTPRALTPTPTSGGGGSHYHTSIPSQMSSFHHSTGGNKTAAAQQQYAPSQGTSAQGQPISLRGSGGSAISAQGGGNASLRPSPASVPPNPPSPSSSSNSNSNNGGPPQSSSYGTGSSSNGRQANTAPPRRGGGLVSSPFTLTSQPRRGSPLPLNRQSAGRQQQTQQQQQQQQSSTFGSGRGAQTHPAVAQQVRNSSPMAQQRNSTPTSHASSSLGSRVAPRASSPMSKQHNSYTTGTASDYGHQQQHTTLQAPQQRQSPAPQSSASPTTHYVFSHLHQQQQQSSSGGVPHASATVTPGYGAPHNSPRPGSPMQYSSSQQQYSSNNVGGSGGPPPRTGSPIGRRAAQQPLTAAGPRGGSPMARAGGGSPMRQPSLAEQYLGQQQAQGNNGPRQQGYQRDTTASYLRKPR